MALSRKTWKKAFDLHLVATESDAKSEKIKTSLPLTSIGERGRKIHESFEFTDGDSLKLKPVLEQFEGCCSPWSNTTINRRKFFTYCKTEGQILNTFVIELKTFYAECEFDNLRDSLIKDMIICGVPDRAQKKKMLREPKLDLKKVIERGQAAEHAKQLTSQVDLSLNKSLTAERGKENNLLLEQPLVKQWKTVQR